MSVAERRAEPLRFALLDGISHGISTRQGGVSGAPCATANLGYSTDDNPHHVRENRLRFAQSLTVDSERIVAAHLSHGSEVTVVRRTHEHSRVEAPCAAHFATSQHGRFFPTDAVVSDTPGLHFLLTFADCVPLAFADLRLGVVGAAHAGWRGTAAGIAGEVIRVMQGAFGSSPRDIVVGIGPSIGPCCCAVGQDVLHAFAAAGNCAVLEGDRQVRLNLWESNREQLLRVGVPADSIETAGICTSCNVDRFFSHRAENGRTGRFGLIIGIR